MKKWLVGLVAVVSFTCGTSRVTAGVAGDAYMVITLNDTASSVSYLTEAEAPAVWTDDYRTGKMVLRRVPRDTAATPPIRNDFYVGIFEVTVGQFKQIRPDFSPVGKADTEAATYDDFSTKGGADGFLSLLTDSVPPSDLPKAGLSFVLPPKAEWEHACRAGSPKTWDYYYGNDDTVLGDYAWFVDNSGMSVQDVGQKIPNAWGLYDMLGNVSELVADSMDMWGGHFISSAADCMCASSRSSPLTVSGVAFAPMCGFRVYLEIPTEYFTLSVLPAGGTGGGSYTNGQIVSITAKPASATQMFDRWTGDTATVADVLSEVTTLTMPGSHTTVTATYRDLPRLTVVNGTGSGFYTNGVTVEIVAATTNSPWAFDRWTGAVVADEFDTSTSLIMPNGNTTVTATYKLFRTLTINGGDANGVPTPPGGAPFLEGTVVAITAPPPPDYRSFEWASDNPIALAAIANITSTNTMLTMPGANIEITATYPPIRYPLTVTGGTGGGSYTHGQAVTITANPAPTSMHEFDRWVGDTYILINPLKEETTATIDVAAKLTATYRPKPMMDPLYMIINLAGGGGGGGGGSSGGVSYTNAPPPGGWSTDLYKTNRMVFKRVSPGTFTMGVTGGYLATPHQVTLTESYYLGLFPVTQGQWSAVRGSLPDCAYTGDGRALRPVENVAYVTLRGADSGTNWPASATVDSSAFISLIRARAGGIALDLPTEAQWEYACRAGTTTAFSFPNAADIGNYAWHSANSLGAPQPVGTRLPNPWGFYDMHGNVGEWCLDWFADYGSSAQTNPKGAAGSRTGTRVWRGGHFSSSADNCRSAERGDRNPTNKVANIGFRLAWTAGVEYRLAVTNGIINTGGLFNQGQQIPITAEYRGPAWKFLRWEVLPANTSLGSYFNANSENTVVTMPARNVAVTAVYQVNDGYTALTVVNGTGSTNCVNGTTVTITAAPPEPWYVFDQWTGNTANVADPSSDTTTFTAAGGAVTLTAAYKMMDPLPADVHLLTTIVGGEVKIKPVQEDVSATITAPPTAAGLGFGWWEVDPAGTPLGVGFNKDTPTATLTMPPLDITLTAIYVKDYGLDPGYVDIKLLDGRTGLPLAGAQWSTDGKDFFAPASKYPLKPGSYTIRFRAPSLNFVPPPNAKITIRAKQTTPLSVSFTWVPVVTGGVALPIADPRDTVTLSPASGQVLPGKTVTLTAKPSAASVFVEWTDGVATASRKEAPLINTTYEAVFRLKTSYVAPPVLTPGAPPASVPTVGVLFSQQVGINERPATFKATGLPPGLKINAATGEITGIPTRAGNFTATVTATNPNKRSSSVPVPISIAPLSPYAQGAFTGYLTNGTARIIGTFTMKASATGALSVKATVQDTSVSFSAKGWTATDGNVFTAQFITKKGETLGLSVNTSTWALSGRTSGGTIGALDLAGQWNLFAVKKNSPDFPFADAEIKKYEGYYTVSLPVTACAMTPGSTLDNRQEGMGYLTLTVNKTGGVKVAGKLSDGTALSASTTLLLTGANKALVPVFAPLYSKRGVASGLLTVQMGVTVPDGNKVAPDASANWLWLYPGRSATATLDGFGAALQPFGAFYTKLTSIEAYYGGTSLTTTVAAVTMNVPLVFNARGVASLSTVAAENPLDAKITVKPATGLFDGSFKREPSSKETVKYSGVLTRTAADAYIGNGAYVLPEKAGTYNLKPSYPVIIE